MIYVARLPEISDVREMKKAQKEVSSKLLKYVSDSEFPGGYVRFSELLKYEPHGRPYLQGDPVYFNLSHSKCRVACAWESCRVGIDIEKCRTLSAKVMQRICTENELELVKKSPFPDRALIKLWTLKESYMKYTGFGLSQGILSVEFSSLEEYPKLKSNEDLFFKTLDMGEYYLSVCARECISADVYEVFFD